MVGNAEGRRGAGGRGEGARQPAIVPGAGAIARATRPGQPGSSSQAVAPAPGTELAGVALEQLNA